MLQPQRRRRAHPSLRPLRPAVCHKQRQRQLHSGNLRSVVQPALLFLQRHLAHGRAQPQRPHLRRHHRQPSLLRGLQQPLPVRQLRRDDVRAVWQRRQLDGRGLQGHLLAFVSYAVRDDRKLQRELCDEASDEQLRKYESGYKQLRRGKFFFPVILPPFSLSSPFAKSSFSALTFSSISSLSLSFPLRTPKQCGIKCPQAPGSVSSCAISSVTGKPACFTTCSFGLTPCVLGATRFSACVDIYGLDNFNCGDCNVQCASGEQCFYGSCFPIGSFGFAEFGFAAFAQQKRAAVSGGGLDSVSALEGNLTAAEGMVPLPPSQLTDGLPALGVLRSNNRSGNGSGSSSGGWWRRRRRRGEKKANSSGLVGASAGGSKDKLPPNYDDDAEFYDDLTAIIEPYRAYMDLRPVEMRPELLSAAPSSVARGGGGSGIGLVGASASPSETAASPHGDVALFPSYNPKMMAAMPSGLGAGSTLLDGAPGER